MSLRRLAKIFFSGLFVLLPVAITLAFAIWLIVTAEAALGSLLRAVIPDRAYRTGMGLAASLIIVFAAGLLTETRIFTRLFDVFDDLLSRIPVIKTVYGGVRDLMLFFSRRGQRRFSRVVMVDFPGPGFRLMGFVTIEDFSKLKLQLPADNVAVYLPMGYQIGGYTLFIPSQRLTPVDMTMEEAMRFVLTAGMSGPEKS